MKESELIKEQQSEIAILKEGNKNLRELYLSEKEKVAKSKQKVIDVCRQLQTAKARLDTAKKLICELCEACGQNVCKSGEECDWKEDTDA